MAGSLTPSPFSLSHPGQGPGSATFISQYYKFFSAMSYAHGLFPPLNDRPIKDTICMFDVDGTLTPARQVRISPHQHTSPVCLCIMFQIKSPNILRLIYELGCEPRDVGTSP
jgi:hypothetical protein